MNSGKREAVRKVQRKKTGTEPQKPCAPALMPVDSCSGATGAQIVYKVFDRKEERHMKPSTTDQLKGSFHELKGKAKEKAGRATNNPRLAAEGQNEKLAGKVQKKIGQIEKVLEK